jgi:energy coupling factor transporter S component ThiW
MTNVRKLSLGGVLIALGVVSSNFYIPMGAAKCFPIQSLINVIAGIILGPLYAVSIAFSISLIRNVMGTGSILAFPGSMVGALLCGLLYKYTKKDIMAFAGEILGTGIIGAILAYPISLLFLSKEVSLFAFVIPFGLSSLAGAAISLIFIKALRKTKVI